MGDITDVLLQTYNAFFTKLAVLLPKLIGALLILIIGWIIAKIFKFVSIKVLNLIRFSVFTEKAGIDKFLNEGGVKRSSTELVGAMFYWLIMLTVILAAFNSLGLRIASELFNEVVLFIPNIIVASLLLVFGIYIARFVSEVLITYFKNIGIGFAEIIGKIAMYAIIVFVVSITLTQLKIGVEIVTYTFLILFGALCLALSLAFGLGGRDWAAKKIKDFTKKVKL